jgi:gamma-glutamyltranspeptidase
VGVDYPVQAMLYGSGFMETGNVVVFGEIELQDLRSTEGGTVITFRVPKERPSHSEVPPMVLSEGEYSVNVTTADGTSNSVVFVLTGGGEPEP